MLRLIVVLLVVANALFLAWSQGLLSPWLVAAAAGDADQREPQRLAAQVRPESIVIVEAAQAEALERLRCLQAGPFDDAARAAAEEALREAAVAGLVWHAVAASQGQHWLRVDAATEQQQSALLPLAGSPALGAGFIPCP